MEARATTAGLFRNVLVLACTLAFACAAIVAVGRLQEDATAARDAELELVSLRLALAQIQDVPWGASPEEGDNTEDVVNELSGMEEEIEGSLAHLSESEGLPERERIVVPFRKTMTALWTILERVSEGDYDATNKAAGVAARQTAKADEALQVAAKRFRAKSVRALEQSRYGSGAVIVLLFAAFAWFYRRSVRARRTAESLAAENRRLLEKSRHEALTDALTNLGNRRALISALTEARASVEGEQVLLALFDLDGFKQYNDTFGHPSGDTLLARLGERLERTMDGIGRAYRMGGDEFCIVASVGEDGAEFLAGLAAAALSEEGSGFEIGCSYGMALIPADTRDPGEALRIADTRMYAQKATGRVSASRQSADVLLRLLAERSKELERHTSDVAALAERTAEHLGLDPDECARIRLAAELHDVGKAAIPDAILTKRGELNENEWTFIRRHTLIAERIVRSAPSLAHTADLVRSHHERLDGTGYPDGLRGEEIPLGARVIAVSDAFDAMISERHHRPAVAPEEALAELRRQAGAQFDATVVEAFALALAERARQPARASAREDLRL